MERTRASLQQFSRASMELTRAPSRLAQSLDYLSLLVLRLMIVSGWFGPRMQGLRFGVKILFRLPEALGRARVEGGEQAIQLARFMRLAEVWAVLMIGSALALAAAAIQLAVAYSP